MPESLAFLPGSLVGVPHRSGDWLASSRAGRQVQVIGGISIRHHRAGVVEIVDVSPEITTTAVESLTGLVRLLGRLHHRAMVVASRLPLDLLRERLGEPDQLGEPAGATALASLLDAGITVVAPATRDELLAAGRGLRRAVPIRHPGGTWLLPPRSPPGDPPAPPRPGADVDPLPDRTLDVRLTDDGGTPVTSGLRPAARYLLRVAIGSGNDASPAADHGPPVHHPTRADTGWELDVVVTAEPGSVDPYRTQLFLPATGGSWTCDCPARVPVHTCPPGLRRQWLDVGLHTAPRPGTMAMVVRVYHGAALLQAVEVTATVGGPRATVAAGALVYCRDAKLDDLSGHAGRAVSCHLDGTATGRHSLVVNNGHDKPVYFGFVDGPSATAAAAMRQVLHDHHHGTGADLRPRIGAVGHPVPDPHGYLDDLRRTVGAGALAYRLLMVGSDDERRLRAWLSEAAASSGRPSIIQLARSTNSRLSVPWQGLYDEPLVHGPAAADVCDSVWRWGPGSTEASTPARCPDAARHDPERGTICPFGFWGLAHIVEVPPPTRTHLSPRRSADVVLPALTTEITVDARTARYATEVVLRHLRRGRPTGDAVRAMRWDLLAHGSVLGLAYAPSGDRSGQPRSSMVAR